MMTSSLFFKIYIKKNILLSHLEGSRVASGGGSTDHFTEGNEHRGSNGRCVGPKFYTSTRGSHERWTKGLFVRVAQNM